MKIVKVVWEDAWSSSESDWTRAMLQKEPKMMLTSVGYLINDGPDGMDLGMEYCPAQENYRKIQHIPKQYIVSFVTLEE